LRRQMMKNAFCLLFFSSGTSMMLGGDEFARTQKGNNNAYCQDNEISWFDWNLLYKNRELFSFCRKAIQFRKDYPILRRKRFFTGKDTNGDSVPDITWYTNDLKSPAWNDAKLKFICFQLDGSEITSTDSDYLLFMIYNSDDAAHLIEVPRHDRVVWHRVVDTSLPSGRDFLDRGKEAEIYPKYYYQANPRSTVLLLGKPV